LHNLNSFPTRRSSDLIQENMDTIRAEMEEVCRGVDGAWEICDVPGVSWTGVPVTLHSYLPAWEISMEEKLVKKAREACRTVLGRSEEHTSELQSRFDL